MVFAVIDLDDMYVSIQYACKGIYSTQAAAEDARLELLEGWPWLDLAIREVAVEDVCTKSYDDEYCLEADEHYDD